MKRIIKPLILLVPLVIGGIGMTGCATRSPLPHPVHVDLEQFMGTWYVHGYTPIVVDKNAYSATESYELDQDRIRTTYRFRQGGFDGPEKVFTPVGTVYNHKTNAEWRMQFVWPFKSEYHIMHLDEAGGHTIIAHPNRKYAWIMSRSSSMDEAVYQEHLKLLQKEGFDIQRIQRVPHKPLPQG